MSLDDVQEEKVEKALSQTKKILNKHKLNIQELIIFYGNLGYNIGASIAGFESQGPPQQELEKEYYSNPTVDVGLMLQGLLITSWEEDFRKNPKVSRLANKEKKEE